MAAGIFYGEPFGRGGVVEGLVGRDQRDGAEAVRLGRGSGKEAGQVRYC